MKKAGAAGNICVRFFYKRMMAESAHCLKLREIFLQKSASRKARVENGGSIFYKPRIGGALFARKVQTVALLLNSVLQ